MAMNESAFITALRSIPLHPGARGLADDCAVLDFGGEALVLTHDMLVEGTHYLPGADMADVAWKLVATNLSDLAAKGAEPLGVLLGNLVLKEPAYPARLATDSLATSSSTTLSALIRPPPTERLLRFTLLKIRPCYTQP